MLLKQLRKWRDFRWLPATDRAAFFVPLAAKNGQAYTERGRCKFAPTPFLLHLGAAMPDPYRNRFLSTAYCLLSELGGPFDSPFAVLLTGNGSKVQFKSRRGEFSGPAVALEEVQEAILAAFADDEVLTGRQIARATGYAYGGRLRSTIAAMCRPPINALEKTPNGYRLRARPD